MESSTVEAAQAGTGQEPPLTPNSANLEQGCGAQAAPWPQFPR